LAIKLITYLTVLLQGGPAVRKIAFITMVCENYDEAADMEIKKISNSIKRLKRWKHEKTTVLAEK